MLTWEMLGSLRSKAVSSPQHHLDAAGSKSESQKPTPGRRATRRLLAPVTWTRTGSPTGKGDQHVENIGQGWVSTTCLHISHLRPLRKIPPGSQGPVEPGGPPIQQGPTNNSSLEEGHQRKVGPWKQASKGKEDNRAMATSYVTVALAPHKTHSRCSVNIS